MDPTQPAEPEQPAQPSEEPVESAEQPAEPASQPAQAEPVVPWQPSADAGAHGSGVGTGALFNNRPAASLTLMDALTTGFNIVQKPTFIVPVLIIGVVVHSLINLVLRPLFASSVTVQNGGTLSGVELGNLSGSVAISVIVGLVGGILLNLYGQIWAVEATAGPLPTTDAVVALAAKRWVSIIGTGLVVAGISIGLLIVLLVVVGIAFAVLGPLGFLVLLAGIVGYAYVSARLTMAGWLAAAGGTVGESINGSWRITEHNLLRIIGWGVAYGIVFGIVGGVLGAVLGLVPIVGPAIATTIQAALGYGGGVTLFRRTEAAAAGMAPAAAPASGTVA